MTYRHHPPKSQELQETWALEAEADEEDASAGDAVLARLPTNFQPVQVGDSEFAAALSTLILNTPLRVSSSRAPFSRTSLNAGRKWALVSVSSGDEAWQSDDDKRSIALALAVGPALEGVDAEVRAMLNPARMASTISIAITGHMALLLAPEPVTKGVATAFTLLMWGYLGWEFLNLLRAYAQLHEDAPHASTYAELREIGERFGRVIGPNSVRILVMVGTAAIGETVALASKAPKLPGFGQAARTVEVNTGQRLMDAATGAERVIVSLNEGTIRVVLPLHAMAMTARNGGGGRSALKPREGMQGGALLPSGHRTFNSFSAFKRHMGKAGEGKEWHHIIEKRNAKRFGAEAIHNTENVIPLEKPLHDKVSAFYSSIQENVTRSAALTVRQWLDTQSYEAQRAFGLMTIDNIRKGVW